MCDMVLLYIRQCSVYFNSFAIICWWLMVFICDYFLICLTLAMVQCLRHTFVQQNENQNQNNRPNEGNKKMRVPFKIYYSLLIVYDKWSCQVGYFKLAIQLQLINVKEYHFRFSLSGVSFSIAQVFPIWTLIIHSFSVKTNMNQH